MRRFRKVLLTSAVLYLVSQILFLINIQFPRGPNFDEFHYIPSAKQFLEMRENQNWEHPPLAKMIMAVGIGLFGDRPIGWRFMSTIFGSLTLVAMYFWALGIFRSSATDPKVRALENEKAEETALWVALLTLVNQLLYVQARIGMLDTFMFAFMAWGLAGFSWLWNSVDPSDSEAIRARRRLLNWVGVAFGLATSCKWFGVIPWALCIGLVLVVWVFHKWETTFGHPRREDWYQPTLFQDLKLKDWAIGLGLIPVLVYYATFLPYLGVKGKHYGLWDLVVMQKTMWEGQGRVVSAHPYMSTWTQWALLLRPIWYAFDKEGVKEEHVRGVILLGNPLVLWAGLAAWCVCLWGWLVERRRDAFLIAVTFAGLYFSWAVIPRKVSFYYYYYPAGMVLSFALGYVFHRGEIKLLRNAPWAKWAFFAAALGFFIYFFPVSAALKIQAESFRNWMWLSSWI